MPCRSHGAEDSSSSALWFSVLPGGLGALSARRAPGPSKCEMDEDALRVRAAAEALIVARMARRAPGATGLPKTALAARMARRASLVAERVGDERVRRL